MTTHTPTEQTPGLYHRRIGDRVVTAMLDGHIQGSLGIVTNMAEADAASSLRARFRADPPRLGVNTFLIRGHGAPVLVDTGKGGAMGPPLGLLPSNLAALGVEPASIGAVLLTHLHRDHSAGLVGPDGAATFPNAEIVLHDAELDFWTDEANASSAPAGAKPNFAHSQAMLAPYRAAGRVRSLVEGEAVAGVSILHLPGHTPGHSGWMIGSGDQALLIWGDIVHLPGVQFAEPRAGVVFDVDGAEAAATRRRTMDMAAADRLLGAGMHLDFPAFGHVARDGDGFRWLPEMWDGGL